MILTDREIKLSLRLGAIIIDPSPHDDAYASTSVDLTLDPTINEFADQKPWRQDVIDPTAEDVDYEEMLDDLTEKKEIGKDGYVLQPDRLVLAWTREYIDLRNSSRLAARIEGKSGLARLGLAVHMTAPTIHGGFNGQIRLEIFNHGKLRIMLKAGMRFCQLVFEQTLGTPDKGYQGRFAGQLAIGSLDSIASNPPTSDSPGVQGRRRRR